jgi:precorrin-6A/cobalt-precorrin-6A reductase
MILVLAGTQDGRELAETLAEAGRKVMISVVSNYAKELIHNGNITINARPLDRIQLMDLIQCNQITAIVDASHPYAVNASVNAMEACAQTGIQYIRYERPLIALPAYSRLHLVHDYATAAKTAAALGKVVFLTTGSRRLDTFKAEPMLTQHRLIARVLPDPSVLLECTRLGFKPSDIIAMQGPFSHELNVALFKEYQAEVIVTKNSGSLGGSDTKITAAVALHLPIVIIDRPKIDYQTVVTNCSDVLRALTEVF